MKKNPLNWKISELYKLRDFRSSDWSDQWSNEEPEMPNIFYNKKCWLYHLKPKLNSSYSIITLLHGYLLIQLHNIKKVSNLAIT